MPITYRAFFVLKAVGTSIHLVGYSINNSVAGLVEYAVWGNAGIGKFGRPSENLFQTALLRIRWIATQPTFAAHLARTDKKNELECFQTAY